MCGVALGEGKDSFEAIPEVPTGSTMGQAWDAEVPELPQATCLVEVLEECERAVAGEEIYQVAGDGGHAVKDASAWCRSCRSGCGGRCLWSVNLWGGGESGGGRGQPPLSLRSILGEHNFTTVASRTASVFKICILNLGPGGMPFGVKKKDLQANVGAPAPLTKA